MNEQKDNEDKLQGLKNAGNLIGVKVANLINVKTIVTIMLTSAFVYLAVIGAIKPDQFIPVVTMAITFYFGTQKQKADDEKRKQ